jgi:hypothetical protein
VAVSLEARAEKPWSNKEIKTAKFQQREAIISSNKRKAMCNLLSRQRPCAISTPVTPSRSKFPCTREPSVGGNTYQNQMPKKITGIPKDDLATIRRQQLQHISQKKELSRTTWICRNPNPNPTRIIFQPFTTVLTAIAFRPVAPTSHVHALNFTLLERDQPQVPNLSLSLSLSQFPRASAFQLPRFPESTNLSLICLSSSYAVLSYALKSLKPISLSLSLSE